MKLHGSLVALVTPMDAGGRIDYDAFGELVAWHLDSGTHGLVVAGTTGESPALSEAEFARLLELAVARAGGRIPVLAGTGTASTDKTIAQSRRAAESGADAVLVVTPYYNRPPQRGLEAHYRAVADAVEVPVVLYNVPGRTGVDLAPETSLALNEHPNIAAIKEAVADPERVRRLVEGGMTVLSGDDASACESMLAGARGVISVAANIVPGRFAKMCEQALVGAAADARTRDGTLAPLYAFLGCESNPIPAKWLLARMGRIGDGIRLPLVPLAESAHDDGHRLLDALKPNGTRKS